MSASAQEPVQGSGGGRRRADKPATGGRAGKPPKPPKPPRERPAVPARLIGLLGCAVLLAGVSALGCAVAQVGPEWIDGAGAIAVSTVLSGALAHRTGGRTFISLLLALAVGLAAVFVGGPMLQTGAAVWTVVIGGVYAVMATVPAVSFLRAAREVVIATVIAAVAAIAAVGFEPTVVQPRFDYAALLMGLLLAFGLVYRLGAGIHGLGRRGLAVVCAGAAVLVLTLAYGELLRRYGDGSVVGSLVDFADWTASRIGAFPRPLVVFLGIPALAWGCFQRARRRQGWWVCAFGVAATVPMGQGLLVPDTSLVEAALRSVYALVPGLLVGYLLVRVDLALTAPRGRRGRRAEEAEAHRPEPARFREL